MTAITTTVLAQVVLMWLYVGSGVAYSGSTRLRAINSYM